MLGEIYRQEIKYLLNVSGENLHNKNTESQPEVS